MRNRLIRDSMRIVTACVVILFAFITLPVLLTVALILAVSSVLPVSVSSFADRCVHAFSSHYKEAMVRSMIRHSRV